MPSLHLVCPHCLTRWEATQTSDPVSCPGCHKTVPLDGADLTREADTALGAVPQTGSFSRAVHELSGLLTRWEDLRAQGREVDVDDLCRDCPELAEPLRRQVEALAEMSSFLSRTFVSVAAKPSPSQATPEVPGHEILGVLGRGGMGVVYKAQHLKLKRVVAVKMVLSGGHAGPQELARFRAEAEAVARLQHPNIVQIHEVGEQEGRPFFSLEYCEGGTLKDKLAGTPLPAKEAAALVEKLARAMQAAHEKGVVHRDLKPANVLLTSEGAPKITDFGLAKTLEPADATTQAQGLTATGAVMGTPSYMAPEQAGGRTEKIGPPCDIYALGAILYECLTGRPPFRGVTPVETVMQVLRDEPVAPRTLNSGIPRDLETICLKSLQKSPERRYDDAAALAEDLRRFQDGEPITARPVGRLERAWRWCGRNRAVAALLAVVTVLLVCGFAVAWYLALTADLARKEADNAALAARKSAVEASDKAKLALENEKKATLEAEHARTQSERAKRVAGFLVGLFDSVDPMGFGGYAFGPDRRRGAKVTAKELLDQGARKVTAELKGDPEVRAALLTTIGSVYRTMGFMKQAEPLLKEGLELRVKTLGETHVDVGESWYELGWLYHQDGESAKAEQCYLKALKLTEGLPGAEEVRSRCRFNLAWTLQWQDQTAEAETLFREVLAERRRRLGDDHYEVAVAKSGLAAILFERGKRLEAVPLLLETITALRRYHGDESIGAAVALGQSGMIAWTVGNIDRAEADFLKAIELVRSRVGDDHIYVAWGYGLLAEVMNNAKRPARAEQYFAQAFEIGRRGAGLEHPLWLRALTPYAELVNRSKGYKEACQIFEAALDSQTQRRGIRHPILVQTLHDYARFAFYRKKFDDAEKFYRYAVEMARELPPGSCRNLHHTLSDYADVLMDSRPGEAIELWREALAEVPRQRGATVDDAAWLNLRLAGALVRLHWCSEAATVVERAADLVGKHPTIAKSLQNEILRMKAMLPGRVKNEARRHAATIGLALHAAETTPWPVLSDCVLRQEIDRASVPGRRIAVGATVTDRLRHEDASDPLNRNSRHHVYHANLDAGVVYQIDLVSTQFDAFLRLENDSGRALVSDDDSGGGLNARIVWRCPTSAPYRIVVTSFEPAQTGQYQLTLKLRSPPPTKILFEKKERLSDTDALDRIRKKSFSGIYTVELAAGVLYRIDLKSTDFDAYLRLEDATGKTLAQDDDGGGMRNARISFRAPRSGPYRIVVTTYKEKELGEFSLTIGY